MAQDEKAFRIVLKIIGSDTPELKNYVKQCVDVCTQISNATDGNIDLYNYFEGPEGSDFYVIAEEESSEEVIGAMAMSDRGPEVRIEATVVKPEYQHRGISRAMFDYLEQHLKGVKSVISVVDKQNKKSLKSRFAMGFEIFANGRVSYQLGKDIDRAKAVKRWTDAEPETALIPAKEDTFDIVINKFGGEGVDSCYEDYLKQCKEISKEIEEKSGAENTFIRVGKDFAGADYHIIATGAGTNNVIGAMALADCGSHMVIEGTVVRKAFQGRGISRAMFNYLEKHLKGYKEVRSLINKYNLQSLKSREDMGFTIFETDGTYCRAEKAVDKTEAVKTLAQAGPETVTIYPRKEIDISRSNSI